MADNANPEQKRKQRMPFMQNRELSWLEFNKRVLDQGADPSIPLLERLQFVSIFESNLREFFMVRVGSLVDLSLVNKELLDSKTLMTPDEQLDAIYARVRELYPIQESIYKNLEGELAQAGIRRFQFSELNEEQLKHVRTHLRANVIPLLTPQIVNGRHPFPHLESGEIFIIVRLEEQNLKKKSEMSDAEKRRAKEERKRLKALGAEGVTLGLIPLPSKANRLIALPGKGFNYILLEDALEAFLSEIFSMYTIKHSNIICITRNADLDATEGADEADDDYREHMKKILKKRSRLAPVRLESRRKLSETVSKFLLSRTDLKPHQVFTTSVPFNMGYAFSLPSLVGDELRHAHTSTPFAPAWPAEAKRNERIIDQVQKRELLFSYPYESMDPFVQLLREAAADPNVVAINITLYRLASRSHLAEALIAAADAGIEVSALFELRARFDESNNIRWSQRFEEAGCNVIYGFHDYKVHSKICSIIRRTEDGFQTITQLGTGNYNEKTARLYTDFSFITTDPVIGRDATEFFRNMGMESTSRAYTRLCVAPLQIKQRICEEIDGQIELAKKGEPCGLFFKTNSITDKDVILKIVEASQAGVPTTLLVRGISCILPGVEGYTDNVRVVSIVGRLLEHSRIYGFGPHDTMKLYLSSADLMTRNMDKRIEIAWPVLGEEPRAKIMEYIDTCLKDTAKLRELRPDGTYTELGELASEEDRAAGKLFDAQEALIAITKQRSEDALASEMEEKSAYEKLCMQAKSDRQAAARERNAVNSLEEVFREALKHDMPNADDEALKPFIKAAARAFAEMGGLATAAQETAEEKEPEQADAPEAKQDRDTQASASVEPAQEAESVDEAAAIEEAPAEGPQAPEADRTDEAPCEPADEAHEAAPEEAPVRIAIEPACVRSAGGAPIAPYSGNSGKQADEPAPENTQPIEETGQEADDPAMETPASEPEAAETQPVTVAEPAPEPAPAAEPAPVETPKATPGAPKHSASADAKPATKKGFFARLFGRNK